MNVLYCSGKYKAVSVPCGDDAGVCAAVSDFAGYGSFPMTGPTEMLLRHDRKNLYLTVVCHEESGCIDARTTEAGSQIWNGSDHLEIFFGAVEPVSWLLQLAVSANGHRFDSTGDYDSWQAQVTVEENCWRAEISLALSKLKIQNLSCGFNLARTSRGGGRISVWSRMEHLFHEFENYGELFFCDYQTAFLAKTGLPAPAPLDRGKFEEAVAASSSAAEEIVHGPWLSNPERTSMTVSFGTAGFAGAFVDYRLQGERTWSRVACQRRNGVLARNRRIHSCCIQGLLPEKTYEYRAVSLKPVTLTERFSEVHRFQTNPERPRDFSFILFSDVHSDAAHVRAVMRRPEAEQADFLVNLGDYLSCTSGPDGYYDAFLDIQAEAFGKERPLVFVRGNHEQIGIFSDLVNEIMPHPGGKSYYSFLYSDVMFVVLDPGNDHEDDQAGIHRNLERNQRQKAWLEALAAGPEFRQARFRICLVHFPPQDIRRYDSQTVIRMIGEVPFNLMLCGHEHRYFRIDPRSGVCDFRRSGEKQGGAPVLPYPVVANDTDTFLQVLRQNSRICTRVITAEGRLIDEITV